MTEIKNLIEAVRTEDPDSVLRAAGDLISAAASDPTFISLNVHPVGFAHAKIAEFQGSTIRLHLWPVPAIDPQNPPWLVHRHAWPLTSYVVRGSVDNEIFSVSPSDRGGHLLYKVGYDNGESVMVPTSTRVTCTRSAFDKINVGERYSVAREAFHSTTTGGSGPTVTIAIAGRPSSATPLVVGEPTGCPEYRFVRQVLGTESAQKIFRAIAP